jgi:hypothetical protein
MLSLVKEIINMKKLNLALAILVTAVMAGNAQNTVTSGIVGFESVDLPANSVKAVGINLLNPDLLVASISSVQSDGFTTAGSSNVGSLLTSGQPYYVELKTGANGTSVAGARFDVDVTATIAAASGKIVLATSSANNTEALSQVSANLPGATFALRKHLNLNDLASNIAGLTSGASGTGDEILMFDNANAVWMTYLRRTATTWRDANNTTVNPIIAPGVGIFIRKRAVPGSITVNGSVRDNDFHINTAPGYQLVTFGWPMDKSLSGIGANVAANGWTYGSTGDKVLALLDDGSGYSTYLYRTSTSWRDANNTTVTDNALLSSGKSFIVFKNASANLTLTKPTF